MNARYLNPTCLAEPPGLFSQVVKSGAMVYLSGQVGVDRDNRLAGADALSQARQIYVNIERALKEVGGDLNSLLRTQIYIVGRENIAGHRQARQELIAAGRMTRLPASTLVLVAGLAHEDWVVEVQGIAEVA
jgi:2-iminobutanoate/2-iminopropanoate deaminase